MKKIFSILGMLSFTAMSYAQVGIHTDAPNATLDVREKSLAPSLAQGVSFPNFTTEERATFTNVKKGTMIYNTTKRCLELYGVNNGVTDWYCICDTCEVAAVTEDDAVVDNIKGIAKSIGKVVEGMVDGVDNEGFFIKEEWCFGYNPAYFVIEKGTSTPIVYDAHSAGKRVEQRYTKEFVSYYYDKSTFQPTDREMDRKNITLVIPAGDFEKGTDRQIIDAYIEIDGNGEFMYTAIDARDRTIYWDVEIGGLKAKVALNLWTNNVVSISCE